MEHRRQYFTGAGNLAEIVAPGAACELEEVRLHLPAVGGSNTFSVSVASGRAPEHNIVLHTKDMSAATDDHYQPTRPVPLLPEDSIGLSWTNAGGLTWGLEVIWKPA